eukprot:2157077-Rhodomonas_salina.2
MLLASTNDTAPFFQLLPPTVVSNPAPRTKQLSHPRRWSVVFASRIREEIINDEVIRAALGGSDGGSAYRRVRRCGGGQARSCRSGGDGSGGNPAAMWGKGAG